MVYELVGQLTDESIDESTDWVILVCVVIFVDALVILQVGERGELLFYSPAWEFQRVWLYSD